MHPDRDTPYHRYRSNAKWFARYLRKEHGAFHASGHRDDPMRPGSSQIGDSRRSPISLLEASKLGRAKSDRHGQDWKIGFDPVRFQPWLGSVEPDSSPQGRLATVPRSQFFGRLGGAHDRSLPLFHGYGRRGRVCRSMATELVSTDRHLVNQHSHEDGKPV